MYTDEKSRIQLTVELAITLDAGVDFAKSTYMLKGDGPVALMCYEVVSTLREILRLRRFPKATAIARELSSGNNHARNRLIRHANECIQPGYDYFESLLT